MSTLPYAGARVAFATMHGKEQLAQGPFYDTLGAGVVAPTGLDTDQFGTFSGEIVRTLSPRAAAQVKARLGMHLADTPYGLASEGSFSSGLGFLVEHHEVLLFIDEIRGLELVEATIATSPLPPARPIATVDAALTYATAIGYPAQGLILRGGAAGEIIHKNLNSLEALRSAMSQLLLHTPGRPIVISPDYRAHRCASRAAVIITLAENMARRLATPCARCHTPGFGQVGIERGLPCSDCGEPTRVIAADIFGCGNCPHTLRTARASRVAAPQWCDSCNP
ncbi:DUF6671 family protein [Cryobacterium psychrophilum]|uniref:DUF6671 domain-containing protein n=1 Tax=Cryobacterium psychrophilum TaxID=41988 RepID=A0A4Y8KL61_9MICO|nr:DUF6671 family protein [Cryobacterium psychrophilum]TDW30001.1 hypothetical protein EDD25_1731 [Cryobacterium psychrophilum]TFD75550.1 hypothetical protein E3T53_15805 [Cryobacterium psychrophilum]